MSATAAASSARSARRTAKEMAANDRAKEREFYRYYHTSQRPKYDITNAAHEPSFGDQSHATSAPPPLPVEPGTPIPSDDQALTAFAQLGALRLNARRCLISFFDRKSCYILAEATRTLSLQTGQAQFEQDRLCWGTTVFPKNQSICYYTVNLPLKDAAGHTVDYTCVPSLVVNDLTQDERFKHYPFVVGAPYSRFYAGVPIRAPSGNSIGTYCVLDEKPRNGLSESEITFLKDMSMTVMRHLEMSRATDDHRRGGVMVRSLGSFAEGKYNLEDWWHDSWEVEPPTAANPTENLIAPRQRRQTISPAVRPRIDPEEPTNASIDSSVASVSSPLMVSPGSGPPHSFVDTPASEFIEDVRAAEIVKKSASATDNTPTDQLSPEVQATFSRAANMIREAAEADGAVFFDAKVSRFGGLVDDEFVQEQQGDMPDKPCAVLGVSLARSRRGSSISLSSPYSMTEGVLRYLLRTYSHGQIFNVDEASTPATPKAPEAVELDLLASGEGFGVVGSRKSDSSKSQDDENLLREVFPRARSLVLYPLWDTHRNRWYAGLIIWSCDPMRVFTSEQELSYLAAFSNSVMADIARLDTKLADAAKGDFISSISHELRSPLHGILGSCELLNDTALDAFQSSMAQTIEMCGKTLLDTINHVLDFAKINNLTRGALKRKKKRSQSAMQFISPEQSHTNDITTLITDVDLAVLTEEVLETVFAGYHFQKTATPILETQPNSPNAPPISVIVDINKSDNYVFRTQPGAWRRVLMNLFGNALKYTPAGYIKVKVQVSPTNDPLDELSEFRLIITDSGIGMSEDYVNNRLFHSFAQENPLSQGTGLGLSIVKQIVESLGGDIDVHSQKGHGTKFTVCCPLKASMMSPTTYTSLPDNGLLSLVKKTEGKNVAFIGFDDEGEYFPVKSLKNKNATVLTLKALESLCTDWFRMKRSANTEAPDLFVASEAGARWLRMQYSKSPEAAFTAPVIIVCQAAASAQSATAITVPGQVFECISQPCGPHKLAKALTSCLDRHTSRLLATSMATDNTLSAVGDLSLKENITPVSPVSRPTLRSLLEPMRPQMTAALSAPAVPSTHSSPSKKRVPQHRSLHCLAVDDNPINLRLLRTFIDKLSHKHTLATNGLEAFSQYKSVSSSSSASSSSPATTPRFDVILMDINMPEMDGLEATRQIRAYERDTGLPPVTIIALTGVASSEAQQEAHVSGVNLFLIKPVRLADLEVVLQGVVTGEDGGGSSPMRKA